MRKFKARFALALFGAAVLASQFGAFVVNHGVSLTHQNWF